MNAMLFVFAWALAGLAGLRLLEIVCERIMVQYSLRKLHPIAHQYLVMKEAHPYVLACAAQLAGMMILIAALGSSIQIMRRLRDDDDDVT